VFVAQELSVDVGLAAAQARLTNLLRDGRLAQASHAAYAGEGAALMRVGPAGAVPGASKLVKVLLLDPVYRCDSMKVAIRWEATGPAGSLFPLLDADISLTSRGWPSHPAGARRGIPSAVWPAGRPPGQGDPAPGSYGHHARPARRRRRGASQSRAGSGTPGRRQ
jgi:hypothetical protein